MAPSSIHYEFPEQPSPNAFNAFLDKLPYCSTDIVSFTPDRSDRAWVDIAVRVGSDVSALRGKIDGFYAKITRGFFEISSDIVVDRRDVEVPGSEPIARQLLDRRWLVPFAPGCVGLQGPALALYDYFDAMFVGIADSVGAVRMKFPTLIGIDTLNAAGYLQSFPHHITLAPHLVGDVDAISRFTEGVVGDCAVLGSAAEPDHVLSPTVCVHCYRSLQGRALADGELLCATAVGNCFRHELGRLDHATRLWDFNMREIIFIGGGDAVLEARANSIDRVSAWLDELGLCYWIETATDPFFVDNYSSQSFFQLANKTKYELQVTIPGAERPLAIGSFNIHHDFFGQAFHITQPAGDPAHTACTAFGVERFVYGFLSQFGLDRTAWPAPVRRHVDARRTDCL